MCLPLTTAGEPPKLADALRVLLPIASDWKIVGTLLEIPDHVLESIRHAEREEPKECLRKMLVEWPNKVDYSPSWGRLAEAVEAVDPTLAQKIRESLRCPSASSNGKCGFII